MGLVKKMTDKLPNQEQKAQAGFFDNNFQRLLILLIGCALYWLIESVAEALISPDLGFSLISADHKHIWVLSTVVFAILTCGIFALVINRKRRATEEALRREEENYQLLVKQIPAVLFRGYKDWSIDFFDRKVEALTGYAKEDFDARRLKWGDLIIPEDVDRARGTFVAALKGDKSYVREYRIRKKDGETLWIQCRGQIFCNDRGEVDYVSGVFFDISQRKQMEEELLKEKTFSDMVVDSLPGIFYLFDDQGRCLRWNHNLEKVTGYSGEEISSMQPLDLVDGGGRPIVVEKMQEAFAKQEACAETVLVARDGRRLPYFVNGKRVVLKGKPCVLGMGIDIANLKKVESALRESEEKYRSLLDNSSEGILLADTRGNLLETNKKMEELLGYSKADLLKMCFMEIHPKEELERVLAAFEETRQDGPTALHNTWILRKDGGKIPVDITGSKVEYAGKTIIQSIFRDITDRRKAVAERLRFSKLESLGTLAGGIAHDFNNILTAMLGNINLALLDPVLEEASRQRLAEAEKACLQAKTLAQQLLTFAKGGAPVKQVTSLANLLTESANIALSGSKVRGEFSLAQDLWSAEVDAGQIAQTLYNLLINAIQALPQGGSIRIGAENVTVGRKKGLPLPEGNYVKITIADQGVGIPPQYLDKIFDPYFTTKPNGSGLGLATVYSVIKNHHGYLTADSQVGAGTVFEIYLPALPGVSSREKETRKSLKGRGRVLVMDDEEIILQVLGKMLGHLGYEARFARDGGQALQMFDEARASGQEFAAVILDLTVPGGMGGKEAIRRLQGVDPQVQAIVSSGYSDDPVMADFRKYGFCGVLPKPFTVYELGEILHEVIGEKSD